MFFNYPIIYSRSFVNCNSDLDVIYNQYLTCKPSWYLYWIYKFGVFIAVLPFYSTTVKYTQEERIRKLDEIANDSVNGWSRMSHPSNFVAVTVRIFLVLNRQYPKIRTVDIFFHLNMVCCSSCISLSFFKCQSENNFSLLFRWYFETKQWERNDFLKALGVT